MGKGRKRKRPEPTQLFGVSVHGGKLHLTPPFKKRRTPLRDELGIVALTAKEEELIKCPAGNLDARQMLTFGDEGDEASIKYLEQRFKDTVPYSPTCRFTQKFFTLGRERRAARKERQCEEKRKRERQAQAALQVPTTTFAVAALA
jgi:hypothetical protein